MYSSQSSKVIQSVVLAYNAKQPVLLDGPPASMRSATLSELGRLTGQKTVFIELNEDSEVTDLLGGFYPTLTGDNSSDHHAREL